MLLSGQLLTSITGLLRQDERCGLRSQERRRSREGQEAERVTERTGRICQTVMQDNEGLALYNKSFEHSMMVQSRR